VHDYGRTDVDTRDNLLSSTSSLAASAFAIFGSNPFSPNWISASGRESAWVSLLIPSQCCNGVG
jgi:hypothetical protein